MSEEIWPIRSNEKLENVRSTTRKPSSHKALLKKSLVNIQSVASVVCRICHTNTVNEVLISPCNCKGSLAYVHLSCLERWLNQSSRNYCELCLYRYSAVESKRYKLCEGIKLWIRHPRNREHVRTDFIIAFLLTLVTAALIVSSAMGMEYFLIEGSKFGVNKHYIRVAVVLFLTTVSVGYLVTMFLIIRDHFVPWFRWWTSTVDIHLLLPTTMCTKVGSKNDCLHGAQNV